MSDTPTLFFTKYFDRTKKDLPGVVTDYGTLKAAKEAAQAHTEETGFPCSVGYYTKDGFKTLEGRYRIEDKGKLVYRTYGR